MTTLKDKYAPIEVTVQFYRNCIVKRVITRIGKLADSRYNGENMRYVNTLQPEVDLCQDKMVVDDAVEDGIARVIKRIEPYYKGFVEDGGTQPIETDMSVIPDHLEFAYQGGIKSFMVVTTGGVVLDARPDNTPTGCAGGSSVFSGAGGEVEVGDVLYTLNLSFPYNWKSQFEGILKRRIVEFMVNHVVAEWMELVSPQDAQYFTDKAEDLLYEVRNTCDIRQGRIHYGWNTTY